MPNWCNNTIIIKSDKDTLDQIEAACKHDKLLSTLAPLPPHDPGAWYETQINHWGTKWEARIVDLDRVNDDQIIIYCATAWDPPVDALRHARATFPDAHIRCLYIERGNCYLGSYATSVGECRYTFPETAEDVDMLIQELPTLADYLCEEFSYLYDELYDEEA